jgi:lysophospholipase L1-like esterase
MTLTFAVLGDSIAYGQGAGRRGDTAGARLAAMLAAHGHPADLHVFAVPGARSDGLATQVRRAAAVRPDLALVVIGANDLTHFVAPQQAAALLGDAVRTLAAAGAQVVVAPAPDLSVLPWIPMQLRAVVRTGSAALRAAQTRAALVAGARVADVDGATSAAFAADPALLCSDRFHPSSAGYALIAEALAPAVRAAASAARSGRD